VVLLQMEDACSPILDRASQSDGRARHVDAIEFIAVIQRDDRGGYISSFPDLPGCNAFAPTEDEVIDDAADALADQLEEMRQAGEAVPIPSAFITILENPEWRGGLAIRVQPGVRPVNRPSVSLGRIGVLEGE
jgi:predicted RNase H-like HicB family nuclease